MELKVFVQRDFETSTDFREASNIADELLAHGAEISTAIEQENLPGASSAAIQRLFEERAKELGFTHERKGLFANYQTTGLRPDFYRRLGADSGILFEVERGKTTINNMDLLDFWKCHICEGANILFLLVPTGLRQNDNMSPRKEFNTVASRLDAFFQPGNETNVQALFLFGY